MGIFTPDKAGNALNKDIGLLIIRLGIGLSMALIHGFGKIAGGPERWERLGSNMEMFGIEFLPVFWGFMAAFSEFFCSILIMLGVFFRFATFLLAVTMLVAVLYHLNLPADAPGSGWQGAAHALKLVVVYVGLFLTGPGKYKIAEF